MDDVERFINAPGAEDVPVERVFSPAMFQDLKALMLAAGWDPEHVSDTEKAYESDFKNRKIVTQFLKDGTLGSKRLASMPDRVTNTVHLASGAQAYRPTVINCFGGVFAPEALMSDWWGAWKAFMFQDQFEIVDRKTKKPRPTNGAGLLVPISRAKYPAVTEHEERISLPLQTMCLAIFDAIQIHMVGRVAPDSWQGLRAAMCKALNLRKTDRLLEILGAQYKARVDVGCLQEVASSFVTRAQEAMGADFAFFSPQGAGSREQNSVLFLRRSVFDVDNAKDVTADVEAQFDKDVPVSAGDVLALRVRAKDTGEEYLIASFHGDTNGLATIPVVTAVHHVLRESCPPGTRLIFGLDANTYSKGKPGKLQDVREFAAFLDSELGLESCWGAHAAWEDKCLTTFNARTYLQPQLNKAAGKADMEAKGDKNPKDFVLFTGAHYSVDTASGVAKDNTGRGEYIENMVFPTLDFPSDHGAVLVHLELKGEGAGSLQQSRSCM